MPNHCDKKGNGAKMKTPNCCGTFMNLRNSRSSAGYVTYSFQCEKCGKVMDVEDKGIS